MEVDPEECKPLAKLLEVCRERLVTVLVTLDEARSAAASCMDDEKCNRLEKAVERCEEALAIVGEINSLPPIMRQ